VVLNTEDQQWKEFEGEFYAGRAADYIVIGNFRSDDETLTSRAEHEESLPFAYYYIDDVEVKKLPPILDVPPDPNDLANVRLEEGKRFVLNNIYFDHDRADFLPRSFKELNTLLSLMRENPGMRIEIHGHTDDVGTDDYNYQLSLSRAYAVVEFLTDNGISPERVIARGYGSDVPVDSNDTPVGRQNNRRVEFLVLSK
jgi:outer membrane protein OmpA-like peptidoglycan-associated protein